MESNGKPDLRIQKTQRALAVAMLGLLEHKSFSKITVNDLCTEAMVSRSAFYSHFEDKYALLRYCMTTLRHRVFEDSADLGLRQRLVGVLERVQGNVAVFKNLLMADLDAELMAMLHQAFLKDFEQRLAQKQQGGAKLPGPPDVIAVYFSSAITNAIIYWVSKNMPYTVEEMADCLCALLPESAMNKT